MTQLTKALPDEPKLVAIRVGGCMKGFAALPDKLSALLRLAVNDAQKCEAMPDVYELDMSQWHEPLDGKCHVCMAGAVLAQTFGLDPKRSFLGRWNEFSAIDAARQGELSAALDYLDVPGNMRAPLSHLHYLDKIIESRFAIRGRADWNTYLAIADALERLGL